MLSKLRPLLFLILPIVLIIIVSSYIQGLVLGNQEEFTRWLTSFGPLLILVYIILQVITLVIAPIGGFVLVVVMISLFGPKFALTLAYLVSTPTYLLNFYLSKRFGRPLVEKILGKTTLGKIDNFIKDTGIFTLIILRLFQAGNFDYLSYGFGLTKIPFKTFAVINILAGIPGMVLTYFIITSFESLTEGVLVSYGVTLILALIPILLRYLQQRSPKEI